MSSLENLRKQAKRILRWHREGHYPVAELIRIHLPEFGGMQDSEILAHHFQLADAQELVARQSGFSSWQALLEGAKQMPDLQAQNNPAVAFVRAEAQLLVADMARSLAFYTGKLGFETRFTYGEPPFYAQVACGEAHLNLRCIAEPLIDSGTVRKNDYLAATICVVSIKELFLQYQAAGVDLHQSLRTEPWGSRTFIVADPDGNLILFVE